MANVTQARLELSHVRNGVITDLTYGSLTYWDKRTGTGNPNSRRITEQGPQQHGVSDLGFRLEQRMIGLRLTFSGADDTAVERKQEKLYELFHPSDEPYSLRFRTAGLNKVYQLDCYTISGPDFSSDEEMEGECAPIYQVTIQLYAPDPVFYDPMQRVESFGLTGGGGAWEIPWEIPWSIGSAVLDQTTQIDYVGTWEEYPQIIIVGPIKDAVITQLINGDALDFTGHKINTGETFTIDLRPGFKSVVDADGVNQIATLADGSDLATWRLFPRRSNIIRVTGSEVTDATQVYIQFYNRYEGVGA